MNNNSLFIILKVVKLLFLKIKKILIFSHKDRYFVSKLFFKINFLNINILVVKQVKLFLLMLKNYLIQINILI